MHFAPEFSTAAIACFSIALVALTYILTVYLGRWRSVTATQRKCIANAENISDASSVAASVIVYAQDDAESLSKTLDSLLRQDYRPGYEIIVVNEGASDDVQTLVNRLRIDNPNLYLTFTPDGARSLSRKKLAITIGVKAAHSPVVVITDDHTIMSSPRWLSLMMTPFADPACEVVLGCRMPEADTDETIGNSRRAYDYATATVTWLSAAIAGAPYRGCSANVAYRRRLFFDNKGFSRSLNLRYGDDDIFINEITSEDNTRVQLEPDSIAIWHIYNHKKEMHRERLAHAFTGEMVPRCSRRLMAAGEWAMWATAIASVLGAVAMGAANYIGWIAAAVLIFSMIISVTVVERKTINALYGPHSRRPVLLLPVLAMTRPLRNIAINISSRIHRERNYTWS